MTVARSRCSVWRSEAGGVVRASIVHVVGRVLLEAQGVVFARLAEAAA
jgi:hypothetical protein